MGRGETHLHRALLGWKLVALLDIVPCGRVVRAEIARRQPRDCGRRWCFDAGSWRIRVAEVMRRGRVARL